MAHKPSASSQWLDRIADRLGRSGQVFLLGLLCACVIEIGVDWNTTLYEINVLRGALRQRGENYADILRKAAEGPMLAYDWEELDRLSSGLFDDPEVVYVRFVDFFGNTLYDRLRPEYARSFLSAHKEPFRAHYRRVMDRDQRGMLGDPAGLAERMRNSRHRDFLQKFTDLQQRLLRRIVAAPPGEGPPRLLYQDRLADTNKRLDRELSYALGTVLGEQGQPYGVVLIAFSNERLNQAILGKLGKGGAITLFFVGLIIVQNLLSRRAKLRLRALEEALGAARAAIRAALPGPASPSSGELGVALAQGDRVGGTVYDLHLREGGGLDLLLAVPEGNGVDAAFAAVVLGDLYRRLRRPEAAPAEDLAAVLAAYAASPHARPVAVLLCRLGAPAGPAGERGGAGRPTIEGVCAGLAPPWVLRAEGLEAAPLGAPVRLLDREGEGALLAGPARPFAAPQDLGVLVYSDGQRAHAQRRLPEREVAGRVAARLSTGSAQEVAEDAVEWARKGQGKHYAEDLFALVFTTGAPKK